MIVSLLFIAGTCIGSFITSLNEKLASESNFFGLSFFTARSSCNHCHRQLFFFDLIPIVSYLYLRGKTRCCHKTIPHHYFINEIIYGLLIVFAYLEANTFIFFLISSIFYSALIAIALFDRDFLIIPKTYLLIILFLGLFNIYLTDSYNFLISATFMTVAVYLIKFIFDNLFATNTFGMGDVLLIFNLGLFVDFFSLSLILFLSSLIGIVHGLSKKDILKTPLPFAMHLVMGSLVYFSLY